MISFLIAIDQIGLIKKIHWSEPVFIINNINQPFSDLFINMEKSFLLQVIEQSQLEERYHENLPLQLSVSAGMAVYGRDTSQIYDLIEYADEAMYQAKKAGKNQYRSFSEEGSIVSITVTN